MSRAGWQTLPQLARVLTWPGLSLFLVSGCMACLERAIMDVAGALVPPDSLASLPPGGWEVSEAVTGLSPDPRQDWGVGKAGTERLETACREILNETQKHP